LAGLILFSIMPNKYFHCFGEAQLGRLPFVSDTSWPSLMASTGTSQYPEYYITCSAPEYLLELSTCTGTVTTPIGTDRGAITTEGKQDTKTLLERVRIR
jgi:hypothetical protein